jgi:NADH-quinone oxidoreductase subunit J
MILFIITSLLLFFFSLNIILSKNTLYSILSLIVAFFLSSILIIQFGLDYISLIFISIYVGALSVLFLFIIMMLNSRIFIKTNNFLFYSVFLFISLIFLFINYLNIFFNLNFLFDISEYYINTVIKGNPLVIIGFLLFTKYFIALLIAGIILFIAMLGSVSLVLEPYKLIKNQIIYQQISRNCNNSFFKII